MKQRTCYDIFYFIRFLSFFFLLVKSFSFQIFSFLFVHLLLMIDDKQSSIVRPKPVPSMFTPVLTPNTQTTTTPTMNNNNINRTPQQNLIEMGVTIRKHDPEAARLFDCIGQVKAFSYNSTELRWENSPTIEGNLCAYERHQIINNKPTPSYAFAIINGDKSLIQAITLDMAQHADKLRLFYEVARNGRREVFCLHFLTEPECLRLHTFLTRCTHILRNVGGQQARPVPAPVSNDPQTQINGQITPTMPVQQTPPNVYRQQIPQQPMTVKRKLISIKIILFKKKMFFVFFSYQIRQHLNLVILVLILIKLQLG